MTLNFQHVGSFLKSGVNAGPHFWLCLKNGIMSLLQLLRHAGVRTVFSDSEKDISASRPVGMVGPTQIR
jgi:hypothetical protein